MSDLRSLAKHLENKYAVPLSQNVLLRNEIDRLKFFHRQVLDPRLNMLIEVMIGRTRRDNDGLNALSKRALRSAKDAATDLLRILATIEEHITPPAPKIIVEE